MHTRTAVTIATLALAAAATACTPTSTSTTANSAAPVPASSAPAAAVPASSAANPAPAGGDKLADVAISSCVVDSALHWPSAEVKITNHTSKSSNYIVQVDFLDDAGTRIGQGFAATNNLGAGQSAVQKAQGAAEATGKVSCKVSDVTRYAAP